MPSVTFHHLGDLEVPCEQGESIFEIAERIEKPLSSACGAKATCSLCQIKVLAGEAHLSEFSDAERDHLGNVYFITKIRLGCQTRITSDGHVVIEAKQAA